MSTEKYPDRWLQAKPASGSGSGRQRKIASAKVTDSQIVLNHAASEMLGNPERVLVRYNPGQRAIRLQPTTPGDTGGFALSGGGNAQFRISVREIGRDYPTLIADYRVSKASNGVLLTPEAEGS